MTIALATIKAALKIDYTDDDTELERIRDAAVAWVENYCGFALSSATRTMYLREFKDTVYAVQPWTATLSIAFNLPDGTGSTLTADEYWNDRSGAVTILRFKEAIREKAGRKPRDRQLHRRLRDRTERGRPGGHKPRRALVQQPRGRAADRAHRRTARRAVHARAPPTQGAVHMISGGLLRWTATVKRATGQDALGMRSATFNTVGTMRCDMRDQSATEQEYADGVSVLKQYEVRVRWPNIGRLSVVETDRLEVRGKTLRINHIRNLDEDDRVAVIECTEVT
jgi:hypothetical protein